MWGRSSESFERYSTASINEMYSKIEICSSRTVSVEIDVGMFRGCWAPGGDGGAFWSGRMPFKGFRDGIRSAVIEAACRSFRASSSVEVEEVCRDVKALCITRYLKIDEDISRYYSLKGAS